MGALQCAMQFIMPGGGPATAAPSLPLYRVADCAGGNGSWHQPGMGIGIWDCIPNSRWTNYSSHTVTIRTALSVRNEHERRTWPLLFHQFIFDWSLQGRSPLEQNVRQ
jgi:hypothetical protein